MQSVPSSKGGHLKRDRITGGNTPSQNYLTLQDLSFDLSPTSPNYQNEKIVLGPFFFSFLFFFFWTDLPRTRTSSTTHALGGFLSESMSDEKRKEEKRKGA